MRFMKLHFYVCIIELLIAHVKTYLLTILFTRL